jgi:glutathione S-transferase
MTELVGIPFSPWSEKARWALEVRRVPYRKVTYSPLLGEIALRRRMGKWSGRVSVPVLFDDDGKPIADSLAIAQWADARGEGESLFPADLLPEVLRFAALSEKALDAGRALSLPRMLDDNEALLEMVPKNLRKLPGSVAIAAFGVRRTLRKYRTGAELPASQRETDLTSALDELRAAVRDRGTSDAPATVLDRFTFADIAMTQVVAFVEPPPFGLRLGVASRRSFTHAALKERYADLIAWRDAVYEKYRPRD